MSMLVQEAASFARAAHAGQVRKYTGEPYFKHCESVARIVSDISRSEELCAAAYLHDTVEDTPVTIQEIERRFGRKVSHLVGEVTDPERPGMSRRERKVLDRERLARASNPGQTLKLADLIDNSVSIVEHDPGFALVYLQEKVELIRVMTRGSPILRRRAWEIVESGLAKLEPGILQGTTFQALSFKFR